MSDQVLYPYKTVGLGRDFAVSIATRYWLDGPGVESWWEARFSAAVQTGPVAHPASYTTGNVSFQGVKRPGRGVEHPPTSRTFVACSRMNFTSQNSWHKCRPVRPRLKTEHGEIMFSRNCSDNGTKQLVATTAQDEFSSSFGGTTPLFLLAYLEISV